MKMKTFETDSLVYAVIELRQNTCPTIMCAVGETVLLGTSSCNVVSYNLSTRVLTQVYTQNNEAPDRLLDLRVFTYSVS